MNHSEASSFTYHGVFDADVLDGIVRVEHTECGMRRRRTLRYSSRSPTVQHCCSCAATVPFVAANQYRPVLTGTHKINNLIFLKPCNFV